MPSSKGQQDCSCLTPARVALAPFLPVPWCVYVDDPRGDSSDLDKDFDASAWWVLEAIHVQAGREGGPFPRAKGVEQRWAFVPGGAPLLRALPRNLPQFSMGDEAARVMGMWGQSPFPCSARQSFCRQRVPGLQSTRPRAGDARMGPQ